MILHHLSFCMNNNKYLYSHCTMHDMMWILRWQVQYRHRSDEDSRKRLLPTVRERSIVLYTSLIRPRSLWSKQAFTSPPNSIPTSCTYISLCSDNNPLIIVMYDYRSNIKCQIQTYSSLFTAKENNECTNHTSKCNDDDNDKTNDIIQGMQIRLVKRKGNTMTVLLFIISPMFTVDRYLLLTSSSSQIASIWTFTTKKESNHNQLPQHDLSIRTGHFRTSRKCKHTI